MTVEELLKTYNTTWEHIKDIEVGKYSKGRISVSGHLSDGYVELNITITTLARL